MRARFLVLTDADSRAPPWPDGFDLSYPTGKSVWVDTNEGGKEMVSERAGGCSMVTRLVRRLAIYEIATTSAKVSTLATTPGFAFLYDVAGNSVCTANLVRIRQLLKSGGFTAAMVDDLPLGTPVQRLKAVRELLDTTAEEIDGGSAGEPSVEAEQMEP